MKHAWTRFLTCLLLLALLLSFGACADDGTARFSRGKTEGNVYRNEFAGLTFTKPGDWVCYSDTQIANLLNVVANYLTNEALFSEIGEGAMVDLYAMAPGGRDSVKIAFAKGGARIQGQTEKTKKEWRAPLWALHFDIAGVKCGVSRRFFVFPCVVCPLSRYGGTASGCKRRICPRLRVPRRPRYEGDGENARFLKKARQKLSNKLQKRPYHPPRVSRERDLSLWDKL